MDKRPHHNGQTLIEVLIAIAVGAILFIGAASTLIPSTKITTQTAATAKAAALQNELIQNVASWASGNWSALLSLATTSAHQYYLLTAQSPFTATSGVESISENSSTIIRYFYVDDVERNSAGQVVSSGGTVDPSTKEVTVVAYSQPSTLLPTTTISFYLTRNGESALAQANWSGGGGVTNPVTTVTSTYATSSNINTSSTGSLTLNSTSTSGAISSSSPHYFGWTDLFGWLDFWNSGNGAGVTSQGLTGYASSSAGPLSLDCHTTSIGNICTQSNYQVANDGSGNLSGYAWNDPFGWTNFEGTGYGTTIGATGTFRGYAWNDVLGWVSVNCADNNSCASSNYDVESTWTPSLTASGYLESDTFDTGSSSSQLNSVVWQGTEPAGTNVEFQFAVSNSSSGPWNAANFTGPDGTSLSYWDPLGPGDPESLGSSYTNFRYFRYLIYLTTGNGTSPTVTSVSVNWSS